MAIGKSIVSGVIILFIVFTLLLMQNTVLMRSSLLVDDNSSLALSILSNLILVFNLIISIYSLYKTWCGSLSDTHRFTICFVVTEFSLMVCRVIGGAMFPTSSRNHFNHMRKFMPNYSWDSTVNSKLDSGTEIWNTAQGEMCCGINGYKDWDKFRPENITSSLYPESCCPDPNTFLGDKGPYCADDSDLYRIGCAQLGESNLSKTLSSISWYLFYQTLLVSCNIIRYYLLCAKHRRIVNDCR